MQAAVIENGFVVNIIQVESLNAFPGLVDGDGARMGDAYDPETGAFSVPEPPAPHPPAEVAMHKVHKAALLTPWGENGETNLKAAIEAAFEQLPSPSDVLARIEWDKAPNLVRDGATTAAVVAILGMTEAQRDELLIFAATLP